MGTCHVLPNICWKLGMVDPWRKCKYWHLQMFSCHGWNQIWLFSCHLSGSQNSRTSNEDLLTRTLAYLGNQSLEFENSLACNAEFQVMWQYQIPLTWVQWCRNKKKTPNIQESSEYCISFPWHHRLPAPVKARADLSECPNLDLALLRQELCGVGVGFLSAISSALCLLHTLLYHRRLPICIDHVRLAGLSNVIHKCSVCWLCSVKKYEPQYYCVLLCSIVLCCCVYANMQTTPRSSTCLGIQFPSDRRSFTFCPDLQKKHCCWILTSNNCCFHF